LLNSHLTFLAFFGFGTIGLKSNEIGSSTPTTMPEEETPTINKDLLLPSYRKRGNKILVFATIDLELEERSIGTIKEKCLDLKFAGGFSGAIKDGVQEI
jgi:hypothetical protein